MKTIAEHTVLIVSQAPMVASHEHILGNGGWLPPEEREALDWLTLVKFMGWQAELIHPDELTPAILKSSCLKYVIIAGDADMMNSDSIRLIFKKIESERVLLIGRAGKKEGLFAHLSGVSRSGEIVSGKKIEWTGDGARHCWQGSKKIELPKLNCEEAGKIWAEIEGDPLIISRQTGEGRLAVFSFHPSEVRDFEGVFTAVLRHLLIWGPNFPVTWFDWSNTVVLRMDDPGSAQTVYHEEYSNNKLGKKEWAVIGRILEEYQARMSIGYVPGWVDDGDPARGTLTIGGHRPLRQAGRIYPSSRVRYEAIHRPWDIFTYDYEEEFAGIQRLRAAGLLEAELHGYTHIHPDKKLWSTAADRYSSKVWYREFGQRAVSFLKEHPEEIHPLYAGLEVFSNIFEIFPTTLICPGEEFTNEVLEKALRAGFKMVSSYYQCIRINDRFCWTQHVCAPYLDQSDPSWFDAELPVVGYFHDFDVAIHGVEWFSRCMREWAEAGAVHFIDFKEMAGRLDCSIRINHVNGNVQLELQHPGNSGLVRSAEVCIRVPEGKLPSCITLLDTGGMQYLPTAEGAGGFGRVSLPASYSNIIQDQSITITHI